MVEPRSVEPEEPVEPYSWRRAWTFNRGDKNEKKPAGGRGLHLDKTDRL
jgi:hypothetical protein